MMSIVSKQKRVLVVKDEPLMLNRVEEILRKEGYAVNKSTSVKDALQEVGTNHYDLIITGTHFNERVRVDVVPLLRVYAPTIPIIVLTDKRQVDDALDILRFGVDEFVTQVAELPFRIALALQKAKVNP